MKLISTTLFSRLTPLAAALLLAPLAGQAQSTVSFGPRLGLNLSTVQVEGEDMLEDPTADRHYRLGAQVGLAADIRFGHFAVQPALLYSQRGFDIKESLSEKDRFTTATYTYDAKGKFKFDYLEFPIQAVYSQREDGTGFQLMAGPYVGLGVGGKLSITMTTKTTAPGYEETDTESASTGITFDGDDEANDDDLHLQRLDFGLNAGLGYQVGPVLVQAGYSLGLTNLIPPSDDSNNNSSLKNRAFQFSLTYLFSPGK